MAKDIFHFDGGPHKRGMDDGRRRKPLTCLEAQQIFTDPDKPGLAFPNSESHNLHMSGDPVFEGLAVGDRIYTMLVPDASGVRGLWVMPQDALAGFEFTAELVDVCQVSAAMCAEPFVEADVIGVDVYGDALDVDGALGLGDSLKDAMYKAKLNDGVVSDYRNPDALQGEYFDPVILGIGQAAYMRWTITAVPDAEVLDSPCNSCSGANGLPHLQYGAIVDKIAVNKQLIADFCTCKARICAGCGDAATDCKNCPSTED